MSFKTVWNNVRSILAPRHLVTFQHLVSEKDQVTANFYLRSAAEVHAVGYEIGSLFDYLDAKFKVALKVAQAEVEAELAKKNKDNKGK